MAVCGWKRVWSVVGGALLMVVVPPVASEAPPAAIAAAVAANVVDLPASADGLSEAAFEPAEPVAAADGDRAAPAFGAIDAAPRSSELSADAEYLRGWVERRNDSGNLPFAIVDKKHARVHVFDDRRVLIGSSVVLTGAMPGDQSVPGVGQRAQIAQVAPHERTTPAGRFPSQPGRNLAGEDIVWFDYGAALAIHRLRPGAAHASRTRRLASATPDDNRASLGCVVVPVEFYERVIRPWLGVRRAVVYVLPDQQSVQAWWPDDAPRMASAANGHS